MNNPYKKYNSQNGLNPFWVMQESINYEERRAREIQQTYKQELSEEFTKLLESIKITREEETMTREEQLHDVYETTKAEELAKLDARLEFIKRNKIDMDNPQMVRIIFGND